MAQSFPKPLSSLIHASAKPSEKLALQITRKYLDDHVHDVMLKAVLAAQWGDYGLPPSRSAFAIHSLIVGHYLNGGYYPVGGAETIAKSIQPIIEEKGGTCLVNHTVKEILVENGRAVGVKASVRRGGKTEETVFHAKIVVSDAGAYNTYCRLLPENTQIPFRKEVEELTKNSTTVATLYLGLRENPAKLGFRGENHWIYEGVDHDELFDRRNDAVNGKPSSCYLSFPSLKDPEAKTHTAEIITPLDYEAVAEWSGKPWRRRGRNYETVKKEIADGLLNLVEKHYPGFRDIVEYWELSTPITVETFTGHPKGSIYGLPATPERFQKPWLKPSTPVQNLYLTGADVATLGIVGAMFGGIMTASTIMGPTGFMKIMANAQKTAA